MREDTEVFIIQKCFSGSGKKHFFCSVPESRNLGQKKMQTNKQTKNQQQQQKYNFPIKDAEIFHSRFLSVCMFFNLLKMKEWSLLLLGKNKNINLTL